MLDPQKASHSHNIVYLRYMEGYIWLLFEIQSFACRRLDGWLDRRVGEINATGGPNSSAETELI